MKCLVLCFVYALINSTWAINDNYTFTYAMAMQCSEYISQHGYLYENFYEIDDALRHTKHHNTEAGSEYLEMHLAIQAASNGHILLSPTPHPKGNDPVYEIVVGGGANKFSELRLNLKKNARSSAKTPKILSPIEFTAFYIRIYDDGLIEFGKEGDSLPILSYYDANTLPIKYFSFASWTGVEAKFLFDCPSPDDADAISPNSHAVEPKLSNSDELKKKLLMSRLPSIAPGPSVTVKLGIKITKAQYDARSTMLTTNMAVVTSWTDDTMAWNPSKFNGTTNLKFRQGQIWRPMFFVYNSDSADVFDTNNPDLISMVYSGESTFHFQTEVRSWCLGSSSGMNKWPHDEYDCIIVIEPWEVHEKINIEEMDEKDRKMQFFADIDKQIASEWEVSYSRTVITPSYWNQLAKFLDNETHQSERYILSINLKRSATTYNIVFYTPLLVLVTFILMSFWSEPLESFREQFYAGCTILICLCLSGIDKLVPTDTVPSISKYLMSFWSEPLESFREQFYAGCTILICLCLSGIDKLVPTDTVPSIMILYITVMYGVLVALLVHVFLTTPLAKKLCRTRVVQTIFTFWLFRKIFFLPPVKIAINSDYLRQEDDDEEATTSRHIEEMESEKDRAHGDVHELAEVSDKALFVVYSITFALMMALHY